MRYKKQHINKNSTAIIVLLLLATSIIHCSACATTQNSSRRTDIFRFRNNLAAHWHLTRFPLSVYATSSVPRRVVTQIKLSIEWWNEIIGYKVFEFYSPVDLQTMPIDEDFDIVVNVKNLGMMVPREGYRKIYVYGDATLIPESAFSGTIQRVEINIDDSLTLVNRIFWTLAHEFGHALGLNHDNNEGSLMFWNCDLSSHRIETRDIQYIREQTPYDKYEELPDNFWYN